MIIRSQDKRNIINMANVCHLQVSERNKKSTDPNVFMVDCCFADTGLMIIATYSTEEKAVKVLDMIQETYGKHFYSQGGLMATADYYVPPFAFIPPKVFQMPEDSEV